jgi:hypothetical protein
MKFITLKDLLEQSSLVPGKSIINLTLVEFGSDPDFDRDMRSDLSKFLLHNNEDYAINPYDKKKIEKAIDNLSWADDRIIEVAILQKFNIQDFSSNFRDFIESVEIK